MAVFFGDWVVGSEAENIEQMCSDFAINKSEIDGVEIIYAWYSYENYSGDALVLFAKDGKLFEINGGHCSCYGLEGQWEPTETTLDAMLMRKTDEGIRKALTDYFATTVEA